MSTHVFDTGIALTALEDGSFTGCTSPAYANIVGPFGGMTAAQAMHAIMLHPERLGEPAAFTVNFAAALADGTFTVNVHPGRIRSSDGMGAAV